MLVNIFTLILLHTFYLLIMHLVVLSLTVSLIMCIFLVFTLYSGQSPILSPPTLARLLHMLVNFFTSIQLHAFYWPIILLVVLSLTVSLITYLSRIYCTFRSVPPSLSSNSNNFSIYLSSPHIFSSQFLSANNTSCCSISDHFFDKVYHSRIQSTFRSVPHLVPPNSCSTSPYAIEHLHMHSAPNFLYANITS